MNLTGSAFLVSKYRDFFICDAKLLAADWKLVDRYSVGELIRYVEWSVNYAQRFRDETFFVAGINPESLG